MKRTFFILLILIGILSVYMNYSCIYSGEAPTSENIIISVIYILSWLIAIWDVSAADKGFLNSAIVFWSANIFLLSIFAYLRTTNISINFVLLFESFILSPFFCLYKIVGANYTSMGFLSIFISNLYILIGSRNLFKK